MKKKMLAVFLVIEVIASMVLFDLKTYATDLNTQQVQTKDEQDKAKKELESVSNEKKSVQDEVSDLNDSILDVQSDLSDLQDKIDELDGSIDEKQKNLDEKQKLLEERLVASYMNGNNTYIDALFSGGLSNFISNYESIKQIADYDNNLINEVKQTKTDLENDKKELESSKTQVKEKETQLKSQKSEREEKVKSLSAEEQAVQAEIEQKENELARINDQIKEEQRKVDEEAKKQKAVEVAKAKLAEKESSSRSENSTKSNNSSSKNNQSNNSEKSDPTPAPVSGGGMAWPTRIAHRVNSVYAPGGRKDTGHAGRAHKGVDIYAPQGTPIYAAKEGTVVYINRSGYGGGWGLYVVIYHGTDSSGRAMYTRYAHGSAIGNISVGSKVSTGTVIMYAGNTGASEGAHLHFEVCLGSMYNQVNPCGYLGISNSTGMH